MGKRPLAIGVALSFCVSVAQPGVEPITITVNAGKLIGSCDNFLWANLGFDPLYAEITAEASRPVLRMIRESHAFRYLRCHNYFSDGLPTGRRGTYFGCRIYSEDAAGNPGYEWWFLDEVLDRVLAAGLKPIVECDFMPDALAEGEPLRNYGGGLVNTPKDYRKWRDLVFATVRHCEQRYGAKEVRQWRWEIWNEPDLYRYFIDGWGYGRPGRWTPKMVDRLNKMYDYFVDGATAADPQIKVGGPGLAGNRQYLLHFLQHVTGGTNSATGKTGTRIDFISWHGYGRTPALLGKNKAFLAMIERDFPSLKDREMQLNEWGQPLRLAGGKRPEPSSNYHEFEAAFLCRYVDAMFSNPDSATDMFLKWGRLTTTDRGGWRTLTRYIGDRPVPAPVFHAYNLLGKLGPERVAVEQAAWPATVRAIAARTSDGAVQVLLYHFDEKNEDGVGEPVEVSVSVAGLGRPVKKARLYRIDREHANFFREWERAGRPTDANDELARRIQQAAGLDAADAKSSGRSDSREPQYTIAMPVNSVALLTLDGEYSRPFRDCAHIRRVIAADAELEKARREARDNPSKATAEALLAIADQYPDLYVSQVALRSLIRLHERRLEQPTEADQLRARLLKTTLGDDERFRLLQARLAFAREREDTDMAEKLGKEIEAIRPRVQRRGPWTP